MRNQDANAREIRVPKLSPYALIEPTHAVIRICCALAVWDAVEEVTVVCSLLPHAFHLRRTRLEVAKVLFTQSRLFIHLYLMHGERGGTLLLVIAGQRSEDSFGGVARSTIGRGVELEGVIWAEH